MLWLRKKEIKDGIIYYYYQIEGEGEWGELYYNPETEERGLVKLAEGDRVDDARYRNHAFCRIEEYVKKNNFPDKNLVAWG